MADLLATATANHEQEVKTIEAETTAMDSGSDEDSTNKKHFTPAMLTLRPSPEKRKRGGQIKGKGTARRRPMLFDPDGFSGEGFGDLEELAKDRYKVHSLDMVEFFKLNEYDGQFGGILADLPYANQASDHARDPPISNESARACAAGMWRMAGETCVVVLGCGSTEQVLLLFCALSSFLLLFTHSVTHTHTHTHR